MNRSTFFAATGTVLLAAGLSLAPVGQAHAEKDYKGISATECQPFLPTTYETAVFKDNAIYNPTNANQRVICPVNKDAMATWTAGTVNMTGYIKAGAKAGKVSCTLYGGGSSFSGMSQVSFTATSETVAIGENGSVVFEGIADPEGGLTLEGWNVLCTLNPGMSLGGFWWGEDFDTDAGN